ncbi:pre-mRNA 3' end processing protein WDR33 isoform X2 [Erpetoichthys calabaricus]|uniref:pre-mRNA 3' end processing protein WDR33 isoform X2 n=1 Tax=Erpetoichthys calabaricus TaxID=27687 RepID=UPI002234190A|nr:pre-mRNA 3' end processing protein WDR33 isoform X2 [Erpetoichthys calabaricus]
MATEIGSPPRFFHMPRFQHQAPRQLFYKRPDFAQQQAMQQLTFDGKRMRKAVNRKTIDYNPSVIRYLENRLWQRDHRDFRAIQPDAGYYNELVPPVGMLNNPMNAVTTKFVRTSTNKVKCPVFVVRWTPEGRRLVTGASSGEFTLWNGLTFNFETILQAHDSPVRAMTWSHNDMWMLTADHGGYVKYWQSNMNNVKMFQAHKEAIREASFSPTDNKFATCSDDGTVRIWDFLRCHEERILRGHGADVKCVDWHPTKGLVVSGSKDSQQPIKFWDPKTGQSLATLHAHKNTVMEVKWNLNGNWLLTASRDHLCKLFDIRNLKEELQVFRGHKKEATAVAWHPVHEGLFASGGSDGSLLFWHTGVEKEVGGMEMAHEGMIWSLAWHPLGHILCSGSNDHTSKFWTRNRPGDKMRDRYNLNLLPGMSEDGVEYDDIEPNNLAAIPGMGIPEQLKMAMEQEQAGKEEPTETEMTIPGLDWGMEEVMQKDQKKVPQKKVPYAKPIPAQFQQAWAENKVPTLPPGELPKERKDEKKVEVKKKTQAEIEQEMAALQYTNPLLLEQMKIERMAQKQSEQGQPPQQGAISSFPNQTPLTQASPNFQQPLQPQQMPTNINPMGSNGPQVPFLPQSQMGPPGPQLHQSHPTQQGFLGPQEVPGSQGIQRHPAPLGPIGPQGPPGMPNNKGIHISPGIPPGQRGIQGPPGGMPGHQPCGIGPRDSQGSPIQGNMMGPQDLRGIPNQGTLVNHPLDLDMRGHQVPPVQGAMMGQPSHGLQGQQNQSRGPQVPQVHGNMQGHGNMPVPGNMQPHGNMPGPGNIQGPGNMQGHGGMPGPGNMQGHGGMPGPGNMQGHGGMPGPGSMPGHGGMPGPGSMPGHGGMPGPGSMPGLGGMPGPGSMPGHGGMPGPGSMPGHGGIPGPGNMQGHGNMPGPASMQGPAPYIQQGKPPLLGEGPRPPFNQVQNQGPPPLMSGIVQQGPGPSKDTRGLPNHHLGPHLDRRGPDGGGGPDQTSERGGRFWGESRDGRRGPPSDMDGSDERFHLRAEENWRIQRGQGSEFRESDGRGPSRGGPQGSWDGRRLSEERFSRESDEPRFRGRREERFENYDGPIDEFEQLRSRDQRRTPHGRHNQEFDYEQTDESYRRGGSRHESRGGRGFSDDFTNEDSFEKEEKGRSWESGGNRGRNRGPHRGGRKGLLPTPDEFPSHYEGGRKSESWDGNRDQGHEHFRDGMRQDHPPRECSSPAGRDRSSSLQSMDMASLPPRKRPWHDGPGTADVRERDSPGRGPEERTPGRGSSQRNVKSGRSASQDKDHHREDGYSGSSRGGGGRGAAWGRGGGGGGSNSSSQSRRGSSRGSSRGSRGR